MASNPFNFNNKIVDLTAKYKSIIKNVHIAIQSGYEEILKQMNLWTDLNKYFGLYEYISKKIDDVTITTYFILGFLNETNTQFINKIYVEK